jgi:glycosyltransferase involved in cell wall biosynthesis
MESWQSACPVIISDQTPWRDLQEKGIGWDISLTSPEKFVEAIEKAAAMNQEEYNKMSQSAFEYAKRFTEDPEVLEANRRLFNL